MRFPSYSCVMFSSIGEDFETGCHILNINSGFDRKVSLVAVIVWRLEARFKELNLKEIKRGHDW